MICKILKRFTTQLQINANWFLDKKIYLKPLDVKLECERPAAEPVRYQYR